MRLTWKDGVATAFMAAMTAVYVMFLQGTDWPIIDSVRGAAGTILVLGMVGGCAMSRGDLYEKPMTTVKRFFVAIATVLGVTALAGAVIALITASEVALGVFFFATAALWLVATLRHAFITTDTLTRDTHEVIR
ncbi:hypothetical protein ACIBG8_08925 [Nonomuraea sp. NPDC050556]|uniref:hypothetical protein n=1 Tax=Nonomuraea sp. NPDC050556 TaxID=3364369 RepID=UPI0037AB023E